MKSIWNLIGRIGGYLSWPLVYIVIMFTTRTKLLILCGDEVLVIKGWLSPGSWSLPGGGKHQNETPEDAVLRETKEETGIVVKKTDLQSLGLMKQTKGHPYKFHGYVVVLPRKPEMNLRFSEVTAAQWVHADAIKKLPVQQHVSLLLSAWQKQR